MSSMYSFLLSSLTSLFLPVDQIMDVAELLVHSEYYSAAYLVSSGLTSLTQLKLLLLAVLALDDDRELLEQDSLNVVAAHPLQ